MKVCLLICMNHPYPEILGILRRLYKNRFSDLLFLIPFEILSDPDVITVYRGSYNHSAYITDAYHRLRSVDCDHFIVMQDDVLLNPKINEMTFYKTFPLGKGDGFIPKVFPVGNGIGSWIWQFGHIVRSLFPKSILFGTGIEQNNLQKYLMAPLREAVGNKIPSEVININDADLHDVSDKPARLLLSGFAEKHDPSREQDECDKTSLDAIRLLVKAMVSRMKIDGRLPGPAATYRPELPMYLSGHYTDFYVLPKRSLERFSHFIGIAAAANLFVEIMTPTVLFGVCETVRVDKDFGLDFSGFERAADIPEFESGAFIAIHPAKLSPLVADLEEQNAFLAKLRLLS